VAVAREPPGLRGITEAHNRVRAGVGVGPLEWSDRLAATAKAWASTCTDRTAPRGLIDHNSGRGKGYSYWVGENVFGSSGTATPERAVAWWAAEAKHYDYATNTCRGVCGHYTQVVWSETREVGCAIASCPKLTFSSAIVCDYGPGGNTRGKRPY